MPIKPTRSSLPASSLPASISRNNTVRKLTPPPYQLYLEGKLRLHFRPFKLGTDKISPSPLAKSDFKRILNNDGFKPSRAKFNSSMTRFRCKCPDCGPNLAECSSGVGCFVGQTYDIRTRKVLDTTYGCLHDEKIEQMTFTCGFDYKKDLSQKETLFQHVSEKAMNGVLTKCCKSDYCNAIVPPIPKKNISNTVESPVTPSKDQIYTENMAISIGAPVAAFVFLLVIIVAIFKYFQRKETSFSKEITVDNAGTTLMAIPLGEDSLRSLIDASCTSGSGSGLPFLVQRTVARQIILIDLVGKGRYGEVWRGHWQGENVAVKIFNSRDEESWTRETEIYNTVMLRHDNILGFIASDIATRNSETCMWLITHYHPNGSLYDYLTVHALDIQQMLLMVYSAACGLAHLHTEIFGMLGKPAIAHRDVKSKNILVKKNGQCVISDLGLAVLHSKETNQLDMHVTRRVGTKRYMSPEILEERINTNSFDSFKQADVYAFGLVIWEIARKYVCDGVVEEYQPPFYDCLHQDPSFEDVRFIVSLQKRRPEIPTRWAKDPVMQTVTKVMQECWYHNPSARLSSLRVKKCLGRLYEEVNSQNVKETDIFLSDKKSLYVSLENGKGFTSTTTSGVDS
ncbi:activin receptor type-1-like isoform X2 [Rhopilema esculentum]|uniref:activin receptor type-1-like isoform X2 n=1 Tax=Rhopilema esculentum TaxID=499914 RepID=UPI0031E0B57C